jgi:hypothetical protein
VEQARPMLSMLVSYMRALIERAEAELSVG